MTRYDYGPSGCSACGGGGSSPPLTQMSDAKGQTTRYAYDLAGRLRTETDALGHGVTYTLDTTGRLLARTDTTGATIQYTYDALGRLLTKIFPDQTTATFTYDASGNMLTAANPHMAYTFAYDLANRLTAVADSRGLTLAYQYDALGRRTHLTYPDGSVVAYTYDAAGRLASLTHAGQTFTSQYDRAGRRTSITAPNGVVTTYTYDAADRLTQLMSTDTAGTVLQRVAYAYDAVGNRITRTDQEGRATYTYDPLDRLVVATSPMPTMPTESFTYDAFGNWMDSTRNGAAQFNAGNQLLNDAHFTYHYDANGNRIQKTTTADGSVTTCAYDAENHLTQVGLSTGTTVHYRYDALGRRIEKRVVNGTTNVTQYVYDHEDLVLELDGAGTVTTRYTHGPGIDEPLLLRQDGQ